MEKTMRNLKKYFRTLPVIAVCLLVLGTAATFAQKKLMVLRSGSPVVKVLLSGMVHRNDNDVPVEKAETVKSGEILDWTITSRNDGDAPAFDYKAIGHVPPGTQFVAGSVTADGSATVSYSIDNGKTFAAEPTIEQKQADGSIKKVPAPVSMYTEIRYQWADPLVQGTTLNASYKVRLK
jgi:uncharacterized repeat protein (TIGR01451 family)